MTKPSKMKNKNEGKRFEEDWENSTPDDWFCLRLKDSSASWSNSGVSRFTPKNMCDFILFASDYSYAIECKSCKGKSFPYKNLNDKKDEKLNKMVEFEDKPIIGTAFYIINFRDVNETYKIKPSVLKYYKETSGRKSLSLDQARDIGYRIEQRLKRTRWAYELELHF